MAGKDAFQIHKINTNSQLISGIILGASVLVGGAYFLNPFVNESSYAADTSVSVGYTGVDWTVSAPTSTAANAGGLDFDITSSSSGVNVAKKDTVTSGTTNVPDYQIYVSVNSTGGKMPATSGSNYIDATAGTVTDATGSITGAAALSDNSWGFALSRFNTSINYNDLVSSSTSSSWSSSKWAKLPYVATASVEDESTIESDATKIYDSTTGSGGAVDVYYAIKANNDLASGDYATTVTYTLIGDVPITGLADGMNMQDVDGNVCANTPLYSESSTTYTLIDSRDNTNYEVRRLADGNCWMVNNLKLTRETISAAGKSYVLDSSNTDLSGSTTFTVPADTSTFTTSSNTTAQIHTSGNATYGAYYSWPAAIADDTGTAHDTRYDNMPNSICPKHWDLPKGQGSSTYSYNNQWYAMLVTGYGLKDSNEDEFATGNPTDFTTGAYNLPFSGFWNGGSALHQGSGGEFWSSTVVGTNYAYNTSVFNDGYVGAGTDFSNKYFGRSVRCLLPSS